MANYGWKTGVSGDWITAADWSLNAAPNDPTADVTIDAAAPAAASYVVTIATGESFVVHSLSMNGNVNLYGSNRTPYNAAQLNVNGTLTFAAGSPGLLGGSLQTFMHLNNAVIVNAGTVNAFIQAEGNDVFTGTNGFYVTNWLQALGTVTVDTTSIAEMAGTTLFDGIFEAKGSGALVNLGGPVQRNIVNIATIEGPPQIPSGWTEVILNGTNTAVNEWNGTAYVGIESTLQAIAARGTVDVLGGRNYTAAAALAVATGGLLNLQAGTMTVPALNLNGGTVQGSGTIAGNVLNNGTLRAVGGILDVTGNLTGTGTAAFDYDQKTGVLATAGATLELHNVAAGQTVIMNGDDTLKLDTPSAFAGTIAAKVGDKIVLTGVTATGAALKGNTLVVSNGAQTVASLAVSGNYAGDSFVTNGSTVTISNPASANFTVLDTTTNASSSAAGDAYTGPVAGVQHQYVNITPDNLSITSTTPNSFIHTGSGNDAINVSKGGGTNVIDGSTGSNFLVGGSGNDTFFVDDRVATADIWSTISGFHTGDAATIYGVTQSGFTLDWQDNQGAAGYTGLTLHASAPGKPVASMTLVGYTNADRGNGRLTVSFGTDTASNSNYMYVHGN